jgi:hypothetical protein
MVLGKREQGVNVILGGPDDQRGTVPVIEYARLIRIEFVAGFEGNPRLAVFRAVDEMDQILDQ